MTTSTIEDHPGPRVVWTIEAVADVPAVDVVVNARGAVIAQQQCCIILTPDQAYALGSDLADAVKMVKVR